jgi:hypothetical protein
VLYPDEFFIMELPKKGLKLTSLSRGSAVFPRVVREQSESAERMQAHRLKTSEEEVLTSSANSAPEAIPTRELGGGTALPEHR